MTGDHRSSNESDDEFASGAPDSTSDPVGDDTVDASTDCQSFVTAPHNSTVTSVAGDGVGESRVRGRSVKTNVDPVEPAEVLEKVESLSITTWEYAGGGGRGTGIRHMGPAEEEFRAEFELGCDRTGIASIDADGVALAAIQGLAERQEDARMDLEGKAMRIEELEAELAATRRENDRLRERLDALEGTVERLVAWTTPESLDVGPD